MRLLRPTLAPALVIVVAVIVASSTNVFYPQTASALMAQAAIIEPPSSSLIVDALPTAATEPDDDDDDDGEAPPPNEHHFNEGFENGIQVARSILNTIRSVVLAFTPSELRNTWTKYKRDVKQVFTTAILTCFLIMAYNYNLLAQARMLEKEIEEQQKEEEEEVWKQNKKETTKKKVNDAKLKALAVSAFANGKSFTRSIAAELAQLHGIIDSGNFLSALLDQLWSRMSDAIEKTVQESLVPTLDGLAVPMHFITLDLGDVPIRIQQMVIHRVNEATSGSGGGRMMIVTRRRGLKWILTLRGMAIVTLCYKPNQLPS